MRHRAPPSGVTLDETDAAIVKGMLSRGDRQHDIAAWFGVNGGRIGEIASGKKFRDIPPAAADLLPPAGPYLRREAAVMREALEKARTALAQAEAMLQRR
ncbi:MAG: hypothetical protein DI552_05345 [Brevundimonas sp.]|uniref:Transposase IS30-like HTH domain-containing protein n=1 Tax=Brevundimonas albigilva TaxID=1312364 RepID=A0ABY4SQU0_9CAUL|nr:MULTISPECIES: hypothetical protein [Brevundimonas]PZU59748.1 MAG: hypothetical protein DI552_05345 [Brevundimonas sp.]URI15967.1 hypothetical protein M8231_02965 [Brevundimonas albigilva]